jgi:hypothetical protein
MSDTTEAALIGLRERLRDLELDAVAVRARVEEVRELIARLSRAQHVSRHGRKPKDKDKSTIVEMPMRVEGGIAELEPQESAA